MAHIHRQEIRFADIDALGHVNNAVYLSYFEQARISFFYMVNSTPWDWTEQGLLLARNEIDYIKPILLGDEISIEVNVTHVGNKSFTLAYHLIRTMVSTTEVCCKGISVLVFYDFKSRATAEIPTLWKEKLKKAMVSMTGSL